MQINLYEDYRTNKLDLSAVGLMKRDEDGYFCTPKDADICGWTGVDGIHYCKIKRFGDMIFCVNPMGDTGRYVFPVAENFEIFLRLLLACKDESYIEQAHAWTKLQFEKYINEYIPNAEAESVCSHLKNDYLLSPFDDPHTYLTQIYDSFDYDKIPYTDEYYEYVPREEIPKAKEWKVYFSFNDHKGGEKPGEPMMLDKHFSWDGTDFYIPCAYICGKGIVLDIFFETETAKTQEFLFRFLYAETQEEHDRMKNENPLSFDYRASVFVNGTRMKEQRAQGDVWAEGFEVYESPLMREVLEHYGMDTAKCLNWRRISFPWATKSKPKIKSISLSLTEHPKIMRGDRFRVNGQGDTVSFLHPITKISHTLTVQEYVQDTAPMTVSDGYEHPSHFTQLSYTIDPPLSSTQFHISDTRRSDLPRKIQAASLPADDFASAMLLIGGADGPTSVFAVKKQTSDDLHSSCSSLSFEPRTDVEWQMNFRYRTKKDKEVVLFLK